MRNGKLLDETSALEVLKHIHQLWGHPVVLASYNEDNTIEEVLSCPRDVMGRVVEKHWELNQG